MHGAGRVVLVDVKVEIGAATGWATGGFSVKQRDFGMRPFRGGPGGSVKVADRVTFDFEAVAVRAPLPRRPKAPAAFTTPSSAPAGVPPHDAPPAFWCSPPPHPGPSSGTSTPPHP